MSDRRRPRRADPEREARCAAARAAARSRISLARPESLPITARADELIAHDIRAAERAIGAIEEAIEILVPPSTGAGTTGK